MAKKSVQKKKAVPAPKATAKPRAAAKNPPAKQPATKSAAKKGAKPPAASKGFKAPAKPSKPLSKPKPTVAPKSAPAAATPRIPAQKPTMPKPVVKPTLSPAAATAAPAAPPPPHDDPYPDRPVQAPQVPLTVSAQGSPGMASRGNSHPANILAVVTCGGWPVTDLSEDDFTIMGHFEVPGQVAGFSNNITSFRNAGSGAYLLQVRPVNHAPWMPGHHLAQLLVSSPDYRQGQTAVKIIVR